jgi:hypothetical protein
MNLHLKTNREALIALLTDSIISYRFIHSIEERTGGSGITDELHFCGPYSVLMGVTNVDDTSREKYMNQLLEAFFEVCDSRNSNGDAAKLLFMRWIGLTEEILANHPHLRMKES